MPIKKIEQITAWSYSRYVVYTKCAFLAKIKHILKLGEGPKGPALLRGSKIHKEAEQYASGILKKRPASLDRFFAEFKHLRKIRKYLEVEQQLAVTKDWVVCGWFAKAPDKPAWLRVVIDVMYVDGDTLVIIDHKTGKIREENMTQLDLYAVVGFIHFPEVAKVCAQFWYLDQGEIKERTYTRAAALKLRKVWVKNTRKMLSDKTFKSNPSETNCKWCPFTKAKGGPCKF